MNDNTSVNEHDKIRKSIISPSSLILLLLAAPILLLSYNAHVDPFLNDHVAYITLYYLNDSHFPFFQGMLEHIPAFPSMILMLSKITSLSPSELEFLPLLGPIFVVVTYSLCKSIFKRPLYSACLTYLMYLGFEGAYYSIWPHGFGFLLFLVFIWIYTRILLYGKRMEYVMMLFLVFVATHLYSYSAELWMVPFAVLINLYTYLMVKKEKRRTETLGAALSFIVILLSFNKLIYNNISKITLSDLTESTQLFFFKFGKFQQIIEPKSFEYVYRSISPIYLSWLNISYLIAIIAPIVIYSGMIFIKSLKNRKLPHSSGNLSNALWFSLIGAGVVHIIAYAILGAVFFSYIQFVYPLVAFALLTRLTGKNFIRLSYLLCLMVIVTSIFSWTWTIGHSPGGHIVDSETKYVELEPSANWFFKHRLEGNTAITDHHTGGRYSIIAAERGIHFLRSQGHYMLYSSTTYKRLVDTDWVARKHEGFQDKYIILNMKFSDKKTWAGGWKDFEPLSKHLSSIDSNININKIYDDHVVSIFIG